jgi:hypothetical protein
LVPVLVESLQELSIALLTRVNKQVEELSQLGASATLQVVKECRRV